MDKEAVECGAARELIVMRFVSDLKYSSAELNKVVEELGNRLEYVSTKEVPIASNPEQEMIGNMGVPIAVELQEVQTAIGTAIRNLNTLMSALEI